MQRVITSFGGVARGMRHGYWRDYTAEVHRLFATAKPYVDRALFYDDTWLMASPWHNARSAKVLAEDSFGWAFKPIVVGEALRQLDEGDLLLWVDSNDVMVGAPSVQWYQAQAHQIYLHDHRPGSNPNGAWTYRDMFIRLGCDEPRYWEAPQVQVNIMAFKKTKFVMDFVDEWIYHACDWDTMWGHAHPNLPGFQQHRHEQSLCTILATKYGIPALPGAPEDVARHEVGIRRPD